MVLTRGGVCPSTPDVFLIRLKRIALAVCSVVASLCCCCHTSGVFENVRKLQARSFTGQLALLPGETACSSLFPLIVLWEDGSGRMKLSGTLKRSP